MGEEVKILFLSSAPDFWEPLEAGNEFRGIFEKFDARRFSLISVSNLQIADLYNTLLKNKPDIVHFAGHGELDEILLEDNRKKAQPVPKTALINLFRKLDKKPKLIFLNACWSAVYMESLSRVVDFVVATREEVDDRTAIDFAVRFYENLFHGTTVKAAFDLAKNYFEAERREDDVEIYELFVREDAKETIIFTQQDSSPAADKPPLNPGGTAKFQIGTINAGGVTIGDWTTNNINTRND